MHLDEKEVGSDFSKIILKKDEAVTEAELAAYFDQSQKAIEDIKQSVDLFYQNLGDTLPEINLEIYKTYKKASVTLDSLRTEGSAGKIDLTVSSINQVLLSAVNQVKNIKEQDQRILAALLNFGSATKEIDKNIASFTAQDSLISLKLRDLWEEIKSLHGSLADPMKKIVDMEEGIIHDIHDHIDNDIQALNSTLNSIALILKDLIKRSDDTKRPILDIMTCLQVHDILMQDLDNIANGIKLLRNSYADTELFKEYTIKIGMLSGDIVNDIADILRDQIESIKAEIQKIQNIILHEREDKFYLTEFLLESKDHGSTFDAVITEVAELLAHILNKLEYLAASKWLIPGYLSNMIEKIEIIEGLCNQYSIRCIGQDGKIADRAVSEMVRLQSDIDFYKLEELKNFIQAMEETLLKTMEDLGVIKDLMLDSIAGIDAYSGRCMECINKFVEDLDNSSYLYEKCDDFSKNLNDTLDDKSLAGVGSEAFASLGDALIQVMERLKHPHIITMKSDREDDFGDMTLF